MAGIVFFYRQDVNKKENVRLRLRLRPRVSGRGYLIIRGD